MSLFMVVSCGKEEPFNTDTDAVGTVSFQKLMVTVDGSEVQKVHTRAGVDVQDFTVQIIKDGAVVNSYLYAEMPSVIELPVGEYTATASLGDAEGVGFDAPYYKGSTTFIVRENDITEVNTIECKLSNVKVTIIYSDDLKAAMADDAKVTVLVGENSTLDFGKNETRSGYFGYVENSNTMVATFSGAVDGVTETNSRVYTDVAPGTHYRITYTLHKPGSDPNAAGTIVPGLKVDARVEVVDVNYNYDPEDGDRPTDDSRPNEGDNSGDNTGGGQGGDTTTGEGPTVTAQAPISLDILNEVTPSSTVVVNATSETGITVFQVDIISDTLTPEVLTQVKLDSHLDLVNPGSLEAAIASLGLPVNVGGAKSVTFDVSSFMSLLAIYGDASHEFKLTVGDASGTVVKSLRLHMNP
jgi:hypothetical protein